MHLVWIFLIGSLFSFDHKNSVAINEAVEVAGLRYVIEDKSELFITGTSNVNSFCCTSLETFRSGELTYELRGDNMIRISQGQLNLTTSMMDCGGKQITKDFQKALRADEFPKIKIILNSISYNDPQKGDEWQTGVADTDIVIAGCSNHKFLDVQFKYAGADRLEAHASTKVCISDFGIEPPTALFGLIKVDDEVEINMRMHLTVQQI